MQVSFSPIHPFSLILFLFGFPSFLQKRNQINTDGLPELFDIQFNEPQQPVPAGIYSAKRTANFQKHTKNK